MAHHHSKQPACANCHYAFVPTEPDEFCPRCGQQNHAVDISFGHVVEEFLEGIFHFDGKVFSTVKLLLFKPGELTRRFLAGHRVPYVPPIRLYVFISFVFFFLLALERGHENDKLSLAERIEAANSTKLADSVVTATQGKREAIATMGTGDDPSLRPGKKAGKRFSSKNDYINEIDVARLPADITEAQIDSVLRSHKEENTFLKRLYLRRAVRWRDASMEELAHQGFRGISLAMFFLMPLAALLLKGFYFRQQRYYLGHLVFTVHLHCFIFLFFSLLLLLLRVPVVKEVVVWIWWLPGLYFVLALHRFYGQSWGKTLVKSAVLSVTYCLALLLAFGAVVGIGALLF
jgi:hypothetical protein